MKPKPGSTYSTFRRQKFGRADSLGISYGRPAEGSSLVLDGLLGGVECAPKGPYRWADVSLCLRRTGSRRSRSKVGSSAELALFVVRAVPDLATEAREHVLLIPTDVQNRPLGIAHLSTGSLSASIVHPREVMQFVLMLPANAFFVVHNHPSGEVEPSAEDASVYRRLAEVGKMLGVTLHDFLVLAPQPDGAWDWASVRTFAEQGVVDKGTIPPVEERGER